MKKDKLSKITGGKYYVDNGCTYFKDKKTLCHFWIKELCINRCKGREHNLDVSFTVTLKNHKGYEETAIFPIIYLYEPYGWLHMGFDTEDFCTELKKDDFDFYFNIILRAIKKDACSSRKYTVGWKIKSYYNKIKCSVTFFYSFWKYDNPDEYVDKDDEKHNNKHTLDDYINFTSKNISIPIICYTLSAVINSLLAEKIHQVPDFIFSMTGADVQTRTELALFYTNLYKRNFKFNKRDYRYTHIMPDDNLSDVYFKMMHYKDSVLTAFEPSKKRMNQLDKMFNTNNFDADKPIYTLCLITAAKKTDIPFETFNIELTREVNLRKIIDEKYTYKDDYGYQRYKNDILMNCIYDYIYKLIKNVSLEEINVRTEFINHQRTLQSNSSYQKLPDIGKVAVQYLCFAYKLYAKIMAPKISYEEVESIIFDTAFIAFPQKDIITSSDYYNALVICNAIDQYFLNNKKAMNRIGTETPGNTKLWYDEQYFYITKDDVQDVLTLQNCSINFSPKIRKALANKGILKTRQRLNNVSKKNTTEYGLHITKPLYGTYYSKVRHYTFPIDECKKNNIFPQISEIVRDNFNKQP